MKNTAHLVGQLAHAALVVGEQGALDLRGLAAPATLSCVQGLCMMHRRVVTSQACQRADTPRGTAGSGGACCRRAGCD